MTSNDDAIDAVIVAMTAAAPFDHLASDAELEDLLGALGNDKRYELPRGYRLLNCLPSSILNVSGGRYKPHAGYRERSRPDMLNLSLSGCYPTGTIKANTQTGLLTRSTRARRIVFSLGYLSRIQNRDGGLCVQIACLIGCTHARRHIDSRLRPTKPTAALQGA
jgi:hypothetical protein